MMIIFTWCADLQFISNTDLWMTCLRNDFWYEIHKILNVVRLIWHLIPSISSAWYYKTWGAIFLFFRYNLLWSRVKILYTFSLMLFYTLYNGKKATNDGVLCFKSVKKEKERGTLCHDVTYNYMHFTFIITSIHAAQSKEWATISKYFFTYVRQLIWT